MDGSPRDLITSDARELVRLLAGTDVAELELTIGEIRVSIKRGEASAATVDAPTVREHSPATSDEAGAEAEPGMFVITSPVVGWFRRSRGVPGGPPIVEEGQSVAAGQVLGVIEAVQVVHDVTTDRAGIVESILVADSQGVEYGQPLVRLREPS